MAGPTKFVMHTKTWIVEKGACRKLLNGSYLRLHQGRKINHFTRLRTGKATNQSISFVRTIPLIIQIGDIEV